MVGLFQVFIEDVLSRRAASRQRAGAIAETRRGWSAAPAPTGPELGPAARMGEVFIKVVMTRVEA